MTNLLQGTLRGGVILNSTMMQIDLISEEMKSFYVVPSFMVILILIILYLIVDKQLIRTLPKKKKFKSTSLLPINRKISQAEDKDFVLKLNTEYKDHPYKRRSIPSSPSSSSISSKESFEIGEIV
jgi:hypothetical protein